MMAHFGKSLLAAAICVLAACGRGAPGDGRLVDIGGRRLHLRSLGAGTPVVVIDSGIGDLQENLRPFQERLSRTTRVVTYDRAGYGRSDPGPLPRDAGREAAELRTLLERAGIPGPFVLVGHSLGGLNAQLFVARFPGDVAALVLLDPPPLSFILGRDYPGLAAMAQKVTGEWQALADRPAGDEAERRQAEFFRMLASEHREMFAASARAAAAIRDFGDIPLIVVAAGKANPAFGAIAGEYQDYWIEQNRILAGKSSRGRFILAERASHALYHDDPGLVEEAVVSLVRELRPE